ncbi:MAG: hypothetical protein Q9165_004762 [Trypethelium subeluteriae]
MVKFRENHTLQNHLSYIGSNIALMGDEYYKLDILPGYTIKANQSVIHDIVRKDGGVEWVEDTSVIQMPDLIPADSNKERNASVLQRTKRWQAAVDSTAPRELVMQSSAEKISLPSANRFRYWNESGSGVDIYIVDSGIKIHHPEFEGRASDFRDWNHVSYLNASESMIEDTEEHGTCLASIAGGKGVGIAKHANIVSVKVGNGRTAPISAVVRALNDVRDTHNGKKQDRSRPSRFAGSVINLSLGGSEPSPALDVTIQKVLRAGIPVVVSAGNKNEDASNRSPCSIRGTVCVAAVDTRYRKTSFSNYGSEVTVSAPGKLVMCAGYLDDFFDFQYRSGTSVSAAYVTGALANFISYEKLQSDTDLVMQRMRDNWNVGFLEGFPENPATPNTFNNNGMTKQNKLPTQPYVGAPHSPRLRR